jgi:hypothetical protein
MNQRVRQLCTLAKAPLTIGQQSRDPDDGDEDDERNDDEGSDSLPDGAREVEFKKAWDQYESNDYLLFGSPKTNVDISSLHPEQAQIFRLWQIYLENVNPLLKVTHTPTLQARIIDATSDIASISPSLEALMFSIYCVSIQSLVEDECRTLFRLRRKDLLTNYQSGCQQALLKCGFLRSSDRDCLTALYLYLVSVSDYHFKNLSPTFLDLCQNRHGCPISVLHAWSCHPDRATHGDSQRVC